MSDFNVSRRGLIKAAGLTAAASSLGVGFAKSACAAEDTWDGYTICDSCNHMPMCGIHFKAKGNTVTWMGNWKEHPNNSLCSNARTPRGVRIRAGFVFLGMKRSS